MYLQLYTALYHTARAVRHGVRWWLQTTPGFCIGGF